MKNWTHHKRQLLASLLGVLLIGTVLAVVLRLAAGSLLQREAERTALVWAHQIEATVSDLDDLFAGHGLSENGRADLRRLRLVREVFRFKLFDRDGHTLLVSDELDGSTPPPSNATGNQSLGHGNETVRSMVLGGANVVKLLRNTHADRPAVYSEAYVPVLRGGHLLGVVEVYVDQVERQADIDRAFLTVATAVLALLALAGGLLAALAWRQWRRSRLADERLHYLARHDPLSGSLNRASFNELLRQAAWRQSSGGPDFAVLCIDLDRFKDINDSLGHAAGDEVLRQVAARLRDLVRHGDMVARLGGDEFALLQTGVDGPEAVSRLCERVVESLGIPYELAGQTVACGCSVGAAI